MISCMMMVTASVVWTRSWCAQWVAREASVEGVTIPTTIGAVVVVEAAARKT